MNVGLQEERLPFWDRLIRGEAVTTEEVDRVITSLSREASDEERIASVLLLAAVRIANTESPTMRRYLRAALLYWFSQATDATRPTTFDPRKLRNPGLIEVMGLQLTWREALQAVGCKVRLGTNYMALRRLQQCLREHMAVEWKRVFGSPLPNTLDSRR